jgi:hypothetical protein
MAGDMFEGYGREWREGEAVVARMRCSEGEEMGSRSSKIRLTAFLINVGQNTRKSSAERIPPAVYILLGNTR